MIKNIIFDLGNVVLALGWNQLISEFAKDRDEIDLLRKNIFESEEWNEFDRGVLSKETIIENICRNLDDLYKETVYKIIEKWPEALKIKEDTIDLIKRLREKGYKTYILSNAPSWVNNFLAEKKIDVLFDGRVISADYKIIKPDERIYEIILNEFNLISKESVFIDDRAENIEVANELGIHGIVFNYKEENSIELLENELRNLDVDI